MDTKKEVKYDGKVDLMEHSHQCTTVWEEIPEQEWVHGFIHTLEKIPMKWYLETQLWHGTVNWADLVKGFILTFTFEDDCPCIDFQIQIVIEKIFWNGTSLTWKQPDWTPQVERALECYNIIAEEDEGLRNIDIEESKGHHKVVGLEPKILDIENPVKTKKVNIGSEEEPKFATMLYT